MRTVTEVMASHGVEVPAHLAADAEIPVCSGLQRQGDVIVVPRRAGKTAGLTPIPAEGVAVVRGEAGGNTHLLVGAGRWAPNTTDPGIMGTLTVDDGQCAYLLHPEHGAHGIGGGHYTIHRQREQADVVRLVAD